MCLYQHEGVQGQTGPTNRNPLHILPAFLWGLHTFKELFLCLLWKAAISSKVVRGVLPSILERPATGFHAEMRSCMRISVKKWGKVNSKKADVCSQGLHVQPDHSLQDIGVSVNHIFMGVSRFGNPYFTSTQFRSFSRGL